MTIGRDTHNLPTAAVDRRSWKAARRAVLIQCETCSAKAAGRLTPRGLTSVDLPARRDRSGWRHADCGGRLVAFDIKSAR